MRTHFSKVGFSPAQFRKARELCAAAEAGDPAAMSALWNWRETLHGIVPVDQSPPPLEVVVLRPGEPCPDDVLDYRDSKER
jgi:hypothetical protein